MIDFNRTKDVRRETADKVPAGKVRGRGRHGKTSLQQHLGHGCEIRNQSHTNSRFRCKESSTHDKHLVAICELLHSFHYFHSISRSFHFLQPDGVCLSLALSILLRSSLEKTSILIINNKHINNKRINNDNYINTRYF